MSSYFIESSCDLVRKVVGHLSFLVKETLSWSCSILLPTFSTSSSCTYLSVHIGNEEGKKKEIREGRKMVVLLWLVSKVTSNVKIIVYS